MIQSHYDEQIKKFNGFTVRVMRKKNGVLINKISVPVTITLRETQMFRPMWRDIPVYVRVSSREFLDILDRNYKNDKVDEMNIIFISDFRDITLSHYKDQPRSMLCTKLEGYFIEDKFGDFVYNWMPNFFRHLNT